MDPISLVRQFGPAVAASVLCVGLYIKTYIELRAQNDHNTRFAGDIKDKAEALRRDIATNTQILARLVDDNVKGAQERALMAQNLATLTNSVNKVVGDLIDVIKEVEK